MCVVSSAGLWSHMADVCPGWYDNSPLISRGHYILFLAQLSSNNKANADVYGATVKAINYSESSCDWLMWRDQHCSDRANCLGLWVRLLTATIHNHHHHLLLFLVLDRINLFHCPLQNDQFSLYDVMLPQFVLWPCVCPSVRPPKVTIRTA